MTSTGSDRPLVVGVDATPAARVALAWAADEALRRHLPLHVVHTLDPVNWPVDAGVTPEAQGMWQDWDTLFRSAGQQVLDDAAFVAERHPTLTVSTHLADGPTARVLREQSTRTAMVVLGSRRLSSLQELLSTGSITVPVSVKSASSASRL
jgi:nucleotide-binding universal stress UspA family protein